MRCINNCVMIEPDKAPDVNGGIFKSGYKRDDMRHGQHVEEYDVKPIVMYSGTVITVPEALNFIGKDFKKLVSIPYRERTHEQAQKLADINKLSAKYDVPIEIKEGDKVYFTRMATLNPNFQLGFVAYSELVARKRGEEIYPLNGCLLVEPVKKETLTNSGIILEWKREEHLNLSRVLYKGELVREYKDLYEWDIEGIEVGDLVWHDTAAGIPIEDKNHRLLSENLHYIHRKDILYYGKERR